MRLAYGRMGSNSCDLVTLLAGPTTACSLGAAFGVRSRAVGLRQLWQHLQSVVAWPGENGGLHPTEPGSLHSTSNAWAPRPLLIIQ